MTGTKHLMPRPRASHNYSQPCFREDMDLWGTTPNPEIEDNGPRISPVLGPDGRNIVHERPRVGFDINRWRK